MKTSSMIILAYGALIMLGGIIGFTVAHSLMSIIMAAIFALLLWGSAFSLYKGKVFGHYTALILASILTLFFSYRYYQTLSFMPSGMMILTSFIVVITLLIRSKQYSICDKSI